jgi:archaellum component FlaC
VQQTPTEQQLKKPEPERKIIKFDTPEKNSENKKEEAPVKKPEATKVENTPAPTKIISDKTPGSSADAAREELEQRRTILQNMKDFDFQIKKSQEDITGLNEKIENLSKDLDDLVSLYEIVSEQMNPFVGLSKVTKKRLDALENFIKEVENVKTRVGELESGLEKNNGHVIKITPSTQDKPNQETTVKPVIDVAQETPPVNPFKQTTGIQETVNEKLTDTEIDDVLSKSFESLLLEQNIDTMINEFLINLK